MRCTPGSCDELGIKFKYIHDCIRTMADAALAPFDLTLAQMRVMAFLRSREGEPISQKDIVEHMHVTNPTAAGIVKRLESKGFVSCRCDGPDRRVKRVFLTTREGEVFENLRLSHCEIEKMLADCLTPEEAAELGRLLTKICLRLSERAEAEGRNCCATNKRMKSE